MYSVIYLGVFRLITMGFDAVFIKYLFSIKYLFTREGRGTPPPTGHT